MAHEIAQIQIVPVDNGFFVQCVNADGSGQFNPRMVANNREELVKVIKDVADQMYTKEPPLPPGQPLHAPSPQPVDPDLSPA